MPHFRLTQQRIPAGLIDKGVEFYVHPGTKDIECLHDGKKYRWEEIPSHLLDIVADDMARNPDAVKALLDWNIQESDDMLKQYIFCRFGGFDSDADIDASGKIEYTEYFDCGKRGQCKYEGKVCATIKVGVDDLGNNINLTKREVEVVKLIAQGKLDKEIADILCTSEETIRSHSQNIRAKGGFARKHDIMAFAVTKNLI